MTSLSKIRAVRYFVAPWKKSSKREPMKHKALQLGEGFRVVFSNRRAQAAEMTLAKRTTEGRPDNRHRGSDKWLYVVSGTGVAVVNKKRYPLRTGTLPLIEHGDTHEIRNTGAEPLRTLNLYVPPAYTKVGEPLPRGRT
jgi:mannose-6-phosphate isomerase-like protein (cupin superfamily)